jgi:FixJ family two-component response regulator
MTGSHILMAVVDDDESVRKAVARLLRVSGYDVELFAGGGEFLESLKTSIPDCVVLDVQMPVVDGLDVQAALRLQGVPVPIIFMTAYDDNDLRQKALANGAMAYLRKPLTEQTLLAAIAKAVAAKRPA